MLECKKIYVKLLFSLILLLAPDSTNAKMRAFFTPSTDCEDNIIQMIDEAKASIDIAVYAINNKDIVEALKRAKKRNLQIRILTDRLQASNKYSAVEQLFKCGFNVKVHNKHKIEHNKFAVFDEKAVVTGSFNWTEAATKKNSENCLFITEDEAIILQYKLRFEELWKLNDKQKSDLWLYKRLSKTVK